MKNKGLLLLVAAALLLVPQISQAQNLDIDVVANPFVDPSYNFYTSTSGQVQYMITNLSSSTVVLDVFQLKFESAVFAAFSAVTPGFTSSGEWLMASGLGLAPGSSILLTVNYTLNAPAPMLTWSEGGPWQQSFTGYWADWSTIPPTLALDGGSSALTPEPTTLLLLGSGLLGLGWRARRRKAKA